MTRRRVVRASLPRRTRPDTTTTVRPLGSSRVSTLVCAGPRVVVTTRPLMMKYGDGGSTSTLAAPPAFDAGTMVTATTLAFSDSADAAARDTVESVR